MHWTAVGVEATKYFVCYIVHVDILELFKRASEFIKVSSHVEKYNSFEKEKPISARKLNCFSSKLKILEDKRKYKRISSFLLECKNDVIADIT